MKISCGVPQGSILGLTLFLIYINDLAHLKLHGQIEMYADDTCVINIRQMQKWLHENRFSLNLEKTKAIVLRNTNNLRLDLIVDNKHMEQVKAIKYPGLLIDKKNEMGRACRTH